MRAKKRKQVYRARAAEVEALKRRIESARAACERAAKALQVAQTQDDLDAALGVVAEHMEPPEAAPPIADIGLDDYAKSGLVKLAEARGIDPDQTKSDLLAELGG